MALEKCPRCELNYLLDGAALCAVCREEVRGGSFREDASVLCSLCGERRAQPGEDLCESCLREMRAIDARVNEREGEGSAPGGVDRLGAAPLSGLKELDEAEMPGGLHAADTCGADASDADELAR